MIAADKMWNYIFTHDRFLIVFNDSHSNLITPTHHWQDGFKMYVKCKLMQYKCKYYINVKCMYDCIRILLSLPTGVKNWF